MNLAITCDLAFWCDALTAAATIKHDGIFPSVIQAILLHLFVVLCPCRPIFGTVDDDLAIRHGSHDSSATDTTGCLVRKHQCGLPIFHHRTATNGILDGFDVPAVDDVDVIDIPPIAPVAILVGV